MTDPTRPIAWANLLTRLWGARFPVDVQTIALEYTAQKFVDPIKKIAAANVDRFEGALFPLPKSGKWAILYNPTITSRGRVNFTLAHELGHYLVHRALNPTGLECGQAQVLGYDGDAGRRLIEQEADSFASYLLMPMDDYRLQVGQDPMCLDMLRHCSERYAVSVTAAAIKWLDFTATCACLVVATNGFVLWCWRSKSAKRRRIYFPKGMALPGASLAAQPAAALSASSQGIKHNRNVWGATTDAREMAVFADRYEMTISLLEFEDAEGGHWHEDEGEDEDTFDRFSRA